MMRRVAVEGLWNYLDYLGIFKEYLNLDTRAHLFIASTRGTAAAAVTERASFQVFSKGEIKPENN